MKAILIVSSLLIGEFLNLSFSLYQKEKNIRNNIENMPQYILNENIRRVTEEAEFNLFIDKITFERDSINYLSRNFKNIIKSYSISFSYYKYDEKNDVKFELSDYPKNVQLSVLIDYNKIFNKEYFKCYEIK